MNLMVHGITRQIDLGYNYRITDIQCALIISQLDKIEKFAARRRQVVERYNEAFSQIPEITVQQEIPESDTTRHLYILRIRPELLNTDRKGFFEALAAENICCNVHYIPVYRHPYYEKLGYPKDYALRQRSCMTKLSVFHYIIP